MCSNQDPILGVGEGDSLSKAKKIYIRGLEMLRIKENENKLCNVSLEPFPVGKFDQVIHGSNIEMIRLIKSFYNIIQTLGDTMLIIY